MAPNGEWDVLGWRWGVGLPIELFDVDHIVATLAASPGAQIDQMVLGHAGEPVKVMDVVRALCRSGGFFPGTGPTGLFRFARLRMANVSDVATATTVTPLPYTLEWVPREGEGIDVLRGVVGELPWDDGEPYEVNVIGDRELDPPNSLRSALFSKIKGAELDLPYRAKPEDSAADFVSMTTFRALGAPTVRVLVATGSGHGHGDFVKLGDPELADKWFVDSEGTLIDFNSDARWYGLVVGHGRNIGNGTTALTVLMTNWVLNAFPRLRAPSAEVASVASATYTVNNKFSTDDAYQFTNGDKVELWRPDGVRRSGTAASPDVQTVNAAPVEGSGELVLDAAFTTAAQAGDIIRLAHLDDVNGFPETGNSNKISGYLAYVFLADTAETLGPNDIAGHIYGAGQI